MIVLLVVCRIADLTRQTRQTENNQRRVIRHRIFIGDVDIYIEWQVLAIIASLTSDRDETELGSVAKIVAK